jgi:hypothetical protein
MSLANAIDRNFTLAAGQLVVGTNAFNATSIGLAAGQVLIGTSTTTAPTAAALTAGNGITITSTSGAISIAATAMGTSWTSTGAAVTGAAGNGYVLTGTNTLTLPTPTAVGQTIMVLGTAGGYTVQAPSSVNIQIGNVSGAAAGNAVSQNAGDALTLIASSTTQWSSIATQGSFNLV